MCWFPIDPGLKFVTDQDWSSSVPLSGLTCELVPQDEAVGLTKFTLKSLVDVFRWLITL